MAGLMVDEYQALMEY